jgi:HK97 family phage major capsid protein
MNAYKVATGIEVSTELIEDSFFNLESYLAKALAVRLARTMEAAYISGDGSSKPLGVLSDTNTKSVTTAVSGVVDSADILSAIYSLQPTSRVGAKIYVADKVMKALSEEVDTTGRPLLQAQAGATAADPVKNTLGGYPIEVNYNLADPEASSESVFIGNPNNYLVRKVRNINVKRDEFSGMANDTVSFYATARVDGKIVSANDSFVKIVTKA